MDGHKFHYRKPHVVYRCLKLKKKKFAKTCICFTTYLKSGALKQTKISSGGVVEKRFRTTALSL